MMNDPNNWLSALTIIDTESEQESSALMAQYGSEDVIQGFRTHVQTCVSLPWVWYREGDGYLFAEHILDTSADIVNCTSKNTEIRAFLDSNPMVGEVFSCNYCPGGLFVRFKFGLDIHQALFDASHLSFELDAVLLNQKVKHALMLQEFSKTCGKWANPEFVANVYNAKPCSYTGYCWANEENEDLIEFELPKFAKDAIANLAFTGGKPVAIKIDNFVIPTNELEIRNQVFYSRVLFAVKIIVILQPSGAQNIKAQFDTHIISVSEDVQRIYGVFSMFGCLICNGQVHRIE